MTKQIEVKQASSRQENIKVTLGAVVLGGAAVAAALGGIHGVTQKPKTHEETVRVEFGDETPTLYDGAVQLRRQGATESVERLENELKAAEPGADGVVHDGDVATVQIDVPNK
jgi:hypothetical protein